MPDLARPSRCAPDQPADTRALERAAATIRLGGRSDELIGVNGEVRNDSERMWRILRRRRREAA